MAEVRKETSDFKKAARNTDLSEIKDPAVRSALTSITQNMNMLISQRMIKNPSHVYGRNSEGEGWVQVEKC